MTLKLSQCMITKILISPKLVPNETSSLELVSRYKLQTEESVLLLGLTSGILESTLKMHAKIVSCCQWPLLFLVWSVMTLKEFFPHLVHVPGFAHFLWPAILGKTTPLSDNKYPKLATSVNHIHHPTNMQATWALSRLKFTSERNSC